MGGPYVGRSGRTVFWETQVGGPYVGGCEWEEIEGLGGMTMCKETSGRPLCGKI